MYFSHVTNPLSYCPRTLYFSEMYPRTPVHRYGYYVINVRPCLQDGLTVKTLRSARRGQWLVGRGGSAGLNRDEPLRLSLLFE